MGEWIGFIELTVVKKLPPTPHPLDISSNTVTAFSVTFLHTDTEENAKLPELGRG